MEKEIDAGGTDCDLMSYLKPAIVAERVCSHDEETAICHFCSTAKRTGTWDFRGAPMRLAGPRAAF
jgi:hypothetical protein